MTIIQGANITHGVAAYVIDNSNDGLRFVADCGGAAVWPFAEVRNTDDARVDCSDCIAARFDAIRADMEVRGWTA